MEVNGLPLTQGEVDQKVNRTVESLKDQIPPDQLEEFKKNIQGKIVDDFIDRTIISQEMDKQKIAVDESEVQKAFSEVEAKVPQGMTLEAMLKQGGVTMEEIRDNIKFSLRANKLFESQVKSDYAPTADEVSTYYNENKKKYDMPQSVNARHILLKVDEKADEKTKAEKKQKIEDLRKQLVGGADFAKLAGEQSDCPSKAKGGDLGTFPRGRMVKPFEDAAFSQKVNEIGPVVQTQFGYHIIQVLEHSQPKQKSLDESKARQALESLLVGMLGALLSGDHESEGDINFDVTQKIRISVVTRPALDSSGQPREDAQVIRVTIQRMVWDDEGNLTHAESIEDPKVYQKFFDRLSKSIFLELQVE